LQEPSAWPVRGSQSQSEASMPPVASTAASGDHATHSTQPLCPCVAPARARMRRRGALWRGGQPPPRAESRLGCCCCQTGGNAPNFQHSQPCNQLAADARELCGACMRLRALQVCSGVCVARSHRRAVVSPLPLARWRPSGLKPTASTASVWPAGAPGLIGWCPATGRAAPTASSVALVPAQQLRGAGATVGAWTAAAVAPAPVAVAMQGPAHPEGLQAADRTMCLGRAPHPPAMRCSATLAARGTRPAAGTRCAARPPQTAARRR